MKVNFKKVTPQDVTIIYHWLNEPHVKEFWDNSQAHQDDIVNFANGRKTPSSYMGGQYTYWLAQDNHKPYALIMTIQETAHDDINAIKLAHLSKTGTSYSIDFMIGDTAYLGKGLASITLSQFITFFKGHIDINVDTFFIDPMIDNIKAKKAFMKAGFEQVGGFIMAGQVSGVGKPHSLLVKKLETNELKSKVKIDSNYDYKSLR